MDQDLKEERINKVEKEVKEIIENFMDKLKEIDLEINEEDFYLIKNKELRGESTVENNNNKGKFIEKWKKTWDKFDKENYLLAEKAKWKR
jgi:Asp-tRNA(Asn)/Glu-tRNA(Gln) amidotransferase C subunit